MQSRKIAICGVLCALSAAIMLIGNFLWVGTYAAPVLAIWMLLAVKGMYSAKVYLTTFLAAAVIALIIVPDRELSIFFCAFGWWPAAKPALDNLKPKALRVVLKLMIYFALMFLQLALIYNILGIAQPENGGGIFALIPGAPIPVSFFDLILIAVGAAAFMVFDSSLDRMENYVSSLIKRVARW